MPNEAVALKLKFLEARSVAPVVCSTASCPSRMCRESSENEGGIMPSKNVCARKCLSSRSEVDMNGWDNC